ncbi:MULTISPECIES: hypothetical protein [Lichenihabitans]|uniref:hypothetical protein n=1 Tax=Lichenihabitans TaxID=2723776 RepID=UPI001036C9B5|nr:MULTISPECIES: hypothetical protein [Lichenihabitans]UDL96206.1 hypothetical protein LGH83_08510 [Lichenihabitans sp. PAMC28606]
MANRDVFGIGETRLLELQPGEQTDIRAESEVSRLKISFGDGAEVELTIGPNEVVRVKQGQSPISILFEDPGVSVHDPLKEAE